MSSVVVMSDKREKSRAYSRTYYQKNREKIIAQIMSNKVRCEACDFMVFKCSLKHHLASKRHKLRESIMELKQQIWRVSTMR